MNPHNFAGCYIYAVVNWYTCDLYFTSTWFKILCNFLCVFPLSNQEGTSTGLSGNSFCHQEQEDKNTANNHINKGFSRTLRTYIYAQKNFCFEIYRPTALLFFSILLISRLNILISSQKAHTHTHCNYGFAKIVRC